MAFCINCGQELTNGAKFCANCGTKVSTAPPPIPQVQEYEKRKVVFDGEIKKCPHCGEPLKSFTATCPACNQEIREAKTASAIALFEEKLEKATSEEQRIVIIQNFGIPNTIEDITEFMILASSNFDAEYYASHLDEADIHDAWWAKIQQCYQKANRTFGSSADFQTIQAIYDKIFNSIESTKQQLLAIKKQQETEKESIAFKKSKFGKTLIAFIIISAICVAGPFSIGNILTGFIGLTMFSLFIISFLMGTNVIKQKNKKAYLIPAIIAFLLFIPLFTLNNYESINYLFTLPKYCKFSIF